LTLSIGLRFVDERHDRGCYGSVDFQSAQTSIEQRVISMFRITTRGADGELVLTLEGYLTGAWVQELETCWRAVTAQAPGARLRVELTGLWRVDAAGRDLLSEMYRAGARLVARGCVMPVLVREIVEAAQEDLCISTGSGAAVSSEL
jgi:ABC-type transporter Mla MlaB component